MVDLHAAILALGAMLLTALMAWLYSVARRDVSIVDSLWSLLFLLGLAVYLMVSSSHGPRALPLLLLVTRYQAIRANNQPHFWLKSLYIVFLLQGLLAWVICLPAIAAVSGQTSPGPLDYAGLALWITGMIFETVGDYQLSRFRRSATADGAVLDTGLWRYTRHPNYFGEAVIWWGFYLIALSAGAWWTLFAPLLMTFLLLRVSGVSLLEKDIADRRPDYRDYVRRTNAFLPGRPVNGN
jgi:steroid 5-alpha reductase family enzyme